MITTTWTKAPADLLGLGGLDVRPALCGGGSDTVAAHLNAPTAPAQGTGLPVGGTAVRLRPVARRSIGDVVVTGTTQQSTTFENNGTTLGNHSSRRPLS